MDISEKNKKNYDIFRKTLSGRKQHAINRAWERFKIKMSDYDYFCLIDQIDSMEAEWVRSLYGNRELWKVRIKDKNLYAVYEPKSKMICSFIMRGMA